MKKITCDNKDKTLLCNYYFLGTCAWKKHNCGLCYWKEIESKGVK